MLHFSKSFFIFSKNLSGGMVGRPVGGHILVLGSTLMSAFLPVLGPTSISIFGSAVLSAGIATLKSTTLSTDRGAAVRAMRA